MVAPRPDRTAYRVYAFTGPVLDTWTFRGRRAAARAKAWLTRLKADPAVDQVFVTAEGPDGWRVVVYPSRRDANGRWVPGRKPVPSQKE